MDNTKMQINNLMQAINALTHVMSNQVLHHDMDNIVTLLNQRADLLTALIESYDEIPDKTPLADYLKSIQTHDQEMLKMIYMENSKVKSALANLENLREYATLSC